MPQLFCHHQRECFHSYCYAIPLNFFTRSSIGGWVEKRFDTRFPLKGFEMNRCAVAEFAVASGTFDALIFSNARASPSGYLVRSDPDASARYSLFREIASLMISAMIGERIMRAIPTMARTPPAPLFSDERPPKKLIRKNMSDKSAIVPTRTITMVMTRISRFWT